MTQVATGIGISDWGAVRAETRGRNVRNVAGLREAATVKCDAAAIPWRSHPSGRNQAHLRTVRLSGMLLRVIQLTLPMRLKRRYSWYRIRRRCRLHCPSFPAP
jgi:hypothetical protein